MEILFDNYPFRIQQHAGQRSIFDVVRKKFVALTPEEWVRQHWLHYLIETKHYPRPLIAVEMQIKVNRLVRRCDIVIHDRSGHAFLIVECKAPAVKITQKVFDQAARYNLALCVPYLAVSNGSTHYCAAINHQQGDYVMMDCLPVL